jgi:hypothetical protein
MVVHGGSNAAVFLTLFFLKNFVAFWFVWLPTGAFAPFLPPLFVSG